MKKLTEMSTLTEMLEELSRTPKPIFDPPPQKPFPIRGSCRHESTKTTVITEYDGQGNLISKKIIKSSVQ